MDEYSKALSYYEKALEIFQKTLPANHPDFAQSYGHIGMVSSNIGEHSKAVLYCERALKILESSLLPNHPHIQLYKDNLEFVKKKL
jgi:tetratricopeptide (TPR) repeat protein